MKDNKSTFGPISRLSGVAIGIALILLIALTIYFGPAAGFADDEGMIETENVEAISSDSYVIIADGKAILSVGTQEEAEKVLELVEKEYQTEGSEILSVDFKEKIEIVSEDGTVVNSEEELNDTNESVAAASVISEGEKLKKISFKEDASNLEEEAAKLEEEVANLEEESNNLEENNASDDADSDIPFFETAEEASSYILLGTKEPVVYTVQKGDTLWEVANDHGFSYYEVQEMNPDINPNKLKIGQEIKLYKSNPFLTVRITEKVTSIEAIPFTSVYETTDQLYNGQSKITSAGVKGSKEVVHEYVKENGVIVEDTVLSETKLTDPIEQHVQKGTATLQIHTGTGVLQAPISPIKVNSGFGVARKGHYHAGVDLGGSYGQDIMAADSGTVIFSGYESTYGNIVKIDHGNGIVTYYAHNSKNLVAYGDTVQKGQVIAQVGKTGNATGYLVHFEVRVNGKAMNPMDYL